LEELAKQVGTLTPALLTQLPDKAWSGLIIADQQAGEFSSNCLVPYPLKHRANFLEQGVAPYRLVQEARGSRLHHQIAQGLVPVGGDKDNRG